MTFEEYLSNMNHGYTVDGGSEDHLIMHELSQRALKITMELNNKYHTKEEIVQLALPYEIILQHASIVSCLCVFGISQSSLGRIMAQENLPSLITLEKICTALGVTLSQFFQEGNSENLTEKQKEVLRIWNNLSTNEQETVMSMLRGLRK